MSTSKKQRSTKKGRVERAPLRPCDVDLLHIVHLAEVAGRLRHFAVAGPKSGPEFKRRWVMYFAQRKKLDAEVEKFGMTHLTCREGQNGTSQGDNEQRRGSGGTPAP